MKKVLSVFGITAVAELVFPSTALLAWLVLAVLIDLVTGVINAKVQGVARTSSGFRKTIVKITQYGTGLMISMLICNTIQKNTGEGLKTLVGFLNDGLIVFMIHIEAVSICENGYAMNPTSLMSKYFFKPVLNLLTFQIKNNPATKITTNENA